MGSSRIVEVTGHLMDTGILSRVLDDIRDYGGDYVIEQFDVGHDSDDTSRARIRVETAEDDALQRLLMRLQTRGVNQLDPGVAVLATADQDGVLPDGFYSTTNLDTCVCLDGDWYAVPHPEMDCGLVVTGTPDAPMVDTIPITDVRVGMRIVVGASGIRVTAPSWSPLDDGAEPPPPGLGVDRPQTMLVRQVADDMRRARRLDKRLLWVAGPGVVHTGAAPVLAALVRGGWVDVLFAGNAFATHDVESALYGTVLGVDMLVQGAEHGHEHHVRALNTIRKAGSIAGAVRSGVLERGVMHALVTEGKRFVLVGSVGDEAPLPDVYTDVVEGRRAMRAASHEVGYCLMLATHLHSLATGNMLPATVPSVCVDFNPTVVTQLTDRGADRARGIVTDVGLFLEQLSLELLPDDR